MTTISRKTARRIRIALLATLTALTIAPLVLKFFGLGSTHSHLPVWLLWLGGLGLVGMAPYLIFADPLGPREFIRAQFSTMPGKTKGVLLAGHLMCIPMLVVGWIGVISPPTFERIIEVISPASFLSDEAAFAVCGSAMLLLCGFAFFLGIKRSLPRLIGFGGLALIAAMLCLWLALR